MASDLKIVQYVEELDLLIIRDGEKLYHIDGDAIAGMFKAYMEGHGIDYDICEGCERKREDNTETLKVWKVDAIRYIRGQREDKASDCETCQNRKTCKDAPIPPRYYCVGYKPEVGSMRLIDADAFKAEGRKLYGEAGWNLREIHYSQLDTECNIDMMPTIEAVPLEDYRSMEQTVHKLTQALAEAEPIKHGRWLRTDAYPHRVYCSECYVTFIRNDEFLKLNDIPRDYCPNCGAKMDEVKE